MRNTISDWTSVPQPQACVGTFYHTPRMALSVAELQQPSHQHSNWSSTSSPLMALFNAQTLALQFTSCSHASQFPPYPPPTPLNSACSSITMHATDHIVIKTTQWDHHSAFHMHKSASRAYVTSAVTSCNSFTHESLGKIFPLRTFNCCDRSHSKSHTQYLYQATLHSLRWPCSSIY